jgi:hypothetical protein
MGWDYYTYVAQPVFFLEAVKDFLVKEQRAKLEALKQQQTVVNKKH